MNLITSELIQVILEEYSLPIFGVHGIAHWARVLENGRRLAASTGANLKVLELFAVFHDSKRINEHIDPGHGLRGVKFARQLQGRYFDISDEEFELLYFACKHHTDGFTDGDLTVQACWDSDRLDIGRVPGFEVNTIYLCTDAAKEEALFQWATRRGIRWEVPDLIEHEWHIEPE